MKKKIALIIDTEGDFYYKIPGPHFSKADMIKWMLNKKAGKLFRYPKPSREGILNIAKTLRKHKFSATFCICGHLYLKECNGFPHFSELKPENPWFHKKIGKDWYYWDTGGNYKTKPGLYFGDLIESVLFPEELFNFGLHGFSHECLTLEKKRTVDSIIDAGMKAAKQAGVKIDSFAAPFNMIEDIKDKDKIFSVLRKHKIKYAQYNGQDNGLEILRGPKSRIKIRDIENRKGLRLVKGSFYFEGNSSQIKIRDMFERIRESDEEYVTLVTHDFTWKNTKILDLIIKKIKKQGYKTVSVNSI
jgi:peptidoglycan/xylan/chitin deacetylase (PgdA/CDA1 family)